MVDLRLNDISLIIAKAKVNGNFPDVKPEEVDYLAREAKGIFNSDSSLSGAIGRTSSRTMALGDSIDAAVSGYFSWLTVLTNQKVTNAGQKGVGGQTTTQHLARVQNDIINVLNKPDICIFGGATNDHSQGIDELTTRDNIVNIANQLRSAGIIPVVRTTPPCDAAGSSPPWNTVALRRAQIIRHNTWLKIWADKNGIEVFDLYYPLVDPATGGYRAGYTSDNTHPLAAAARAAVEYLIANKGIPSVFKGDVSHLLGKSKGDSLLLNGLIIGDANADGVADSWTKTAGTSTITAALSLPRLGNAQKLAETTTVATQVYTDASPYSDAARKDHVVVYIAYVKVITGSATEGGFKFRGSKVPSGDLGPLPGSGFEGIFYLEGVFNSAMTNKYTDFNTRMQAMVDAGSASDIEISQAAIRDLTDLGF